mmetsp:Transcript_47319/g.98663  ORF Transcript_47319/g.98663 Transcript_47319/m.98663 type:complete len:111 (+) Transcript_47319:501-833(+)
MVGLQSIFRFGRPNGQAEDRSLLRRAAARQKLHSMLQADNSRLKLPGWCAFSWPDLPADWTVVRTNQAGIHRFPARRSPRRAVWRVEVETNGQMKYRVFAAAHARGPLLS